MMAPPPPPPAAPPPPAPLAPPPPAPLAPPPPAPNVPPPPPPAPLPPPLSTPSPTPTTPSPTPDIRLPQQETPLPRAKMKTINWNKIPNNKVIGQNNIWSIVASSHKHSPKTELDWGEIEGLFCQQIQPTGSAGSSPRLGRSPICDSSGERKPRKESSEITLLDGKRSLNVNIFLKQFRSSNEDIIQLIREGSHDDIGAEKLRGLLKILPEVDECEMLKVFHGDVSKLGNAEKFLLQLIQLPNYKLRIECMLLKEEWSSTAGYLESAINAILVAGDDLMSSRALQLTNILPWIKSSDDPTCRFRPKHYWNSEISRAVAERRPALAMGRRNPTPENFATWNDKVAKAKQLIKNASAKAWREFCTSVDHESSAATMWRKMRWVKGSGEAGQALNLKQL
ncbi:hypothetical protein ACJJTC_004688 [Scirpophaga incertulas]